MAYNVVFDVAQSGYRQWTFVIVGLGLMALAGRLVTIQRKLPTQLHLAPAHKWFGFLSFWALIVLVATFGDYVRLVWDLRTGRCQVTEGIVTDFHPSPYTARGKDWFTVDGQRFEYADNIATAGFNQTESHGGPVHQGLQVRIHHVGNEIARLEVAR